MQNYGNTSESRGLRGRKRAATRRAIERAAVCLAFKNGYDATTVEAICSEADVSLRTFFNYFETKEAAILGDIVGPVSTERILELLEENAPDTLAGVSAAWVDNIGLEDDPSFVLQRRAVRCANPYLAHRHTTARFEHRRDIGTVLAAYLCEHPDVRRLPDVTEEEEAQIVVGIVEAAAQHAADRWSLGESAAPLGLSNLRDALEKIGRVLREESFGTE
jgi:AcrR family transcriptional regulator